MERLERLAREMEGSSRDLRLKSIIMGGGGLKRGVKKK